MINESKPLTFSFSTMTEMGPASTLSMTISEFTFLHGYIYTFTTDFCGVTDGHIQGRISLDHRPYILVTWSAPELGSGLGNFEIMTGAVFANTVLVGNPLHILRPVPSHLADSTQFQQLWENLVYFTRHNVGVPVPIPLRLERPLLEIQELDELGCFDLFKNDEETIVQYCFCLDSIWNLSVKTWSQK